MHYNIFMVYCLGTSSFSRATHICSYMRKNTEVQRTSSTTWSRITPQGIYTMPTCTEETRLYSVLSLSSEDIFLRNCCALQCIISLKNTYSSAFTIWICFSKDYNILPMHVNWIIYALNANLSNNKVYTFHSIILGEMPVIEFQQVFIYMTVPPIKCCATLHLRGNYAYVCNLSTYNISMPLLLYII